MERGWYKVKFEGEWGCAFNDGSDCSPWSFGWCILQDEDLDEIGEKITFPSYDETTKNE